MSGRAPRGPAPRAPHARVRAAAPPAAREPEGRRPERVAASDRPVTVCPRCFMAIPSTGLCDNCD